MLRSLEHRGVGRFADVHKQLDVSAIASTATGDSWSREYRLSVAQDPEVSYTLRDHSYATIELYHNVRREIDAMEDQMPILIPHPQSDATA